MSIESLKLIDIRGAQIKENTLVEASIIRTVKAHRKKDKKKAIAESLNNEIDVRDRWLGLRQLKKGYQITPYALKVKDRNRVTKDSIAETMAEHLANNTWNNIDADGEEKTISNRKVV